MKTFFKYLLSYILLFVVILGILGGTGYYLYSTGWVEKTLSELVLPFNWFGQSEISPVGHLQVKDIDRRSISEYKESIKPLTKQIKDNYKKKPNTDSLKISKDSKDELDKILQKIYGVEYTYASDINIAGLLLTSDGWFGLMNIAVVGDTNTYTNKLISFSLNDNLEINDVSVYLEDEQKFAYSEIPDDFDQDIIDQALTDAMTVFTDISIESSKDPFIINNRQFLDNVVMSKLQFIYSYVRIYSVYSVGTDKGVIEYNHTFHLDEDRKE